MLSNNTVPDKQQVLQKMEAATIFIVPGNGTKWSLKSHSSLRIYVTLEIYLTCSKRSPFPLLAKLSYRQEFIFLFTNSLHQNCSPGLHITPVVTWMLLGVLINRIPWWSKFKKHCIMYPFSWRVYEHKCSQN